MSAENLAVSKAETVNSLEPFTKEGKRRFQQGELRQQQRRAIAQTSYLLNTPTAEESKVLHDLFLRIKWNGFIKTIFKWCIMRTIKFPNTI